MRRFENTTPPNNKFWEIQIIRDGHGQYRVFKRWGKLYTSGIGQSRIFTLAHAADMFVEYQIKTKLEKGYSEIGLQPVGRSIPVVNFGNTIQNQLAPPSKTQMICVACRKNQSTSATDRCSDCIRNKRTISNYTPPEEKKDRFELIELD